jgi:hypothetical protein
MEIDGALRGAAAGPPVGADMAGGVALGAAVAAGGDEGDGVCAALPDANCSRVLAATRPASQRDITTP